MSSAKANRLRVVVDGSNLATEGRTIPSLVQLDEAVRSFLEENPHAEVIVVVDASFEHRVATAERSRFKEAELAGEIVTPPAGAIGRGDAFILKIAQRINALVLSNDSFQEFHDEYPWLFDPDRLIGGKPVKGVGWVFTPRIPVRGVKAARAVKKLTVTLPDGTKPTIGTTLTPVKATKAVTKKALKSTKPTVKVAKKVAKVTESTVKLAEAPSKKVAKKVPAAKKTAAAKPSVSATKRTPKAPTVVAETTVSEPAPALRRGRQPVNPEADFIQFKAASKIGSKIEGEVTAFTSHGAVIKVRLKNGNQVECYAPTTSLGDPAPARARDVLKRGDVRTFRLVTVDSERRIAELALT
ncbi:MAG: NYN domain-containing protein [Acidimicrobiales bacterium]